MRWAIAAAICIAAAVLEGVMAGANHFEVLRRLKQPRWSPSFPVWIAIGLVWYGICFAALVRLQDGPGIVSVPAVLLMVLITANAVWNYVLFRAKQLDTAFIYLLIYGVMLAVFLWTAREDRVTLILFAIYAIYLPYAAVWIWRLWQLNGSRA